MNQQSLTQQTTHEHYMRIALAYAKRHVGMTGENPSVGCVLVKDDDIIAATTTAIGGSPHAETQALAFAGSNAAGATAYVTLEPCAHHGKNGPCADALIAVGIQQVVVAMIDPFPRVAGDGIKRLQKAGIDVVTPVLEKEAQEVNRSFFHRVLKQRPWVSLKLATSLDGKASLENGSSQWITGEWSRKRGHLMRVRHDAILTGVNTVLADNPQLNCRLDGLEGQSPLRIVVDTHLRIPISSRIVQTSNENTTIIMTSSQDNSKRENLRQLGVEIVEAPLDKTGRINLTYMLNDLAKRGVSSLMVESGSAVATSLMQSNLVDEMYWFKANKLLGDDAMAAVGALSIESLSQVESWELTHQQAIESDILSIFRL